MDSRTAARIRLAARTGYILLVLLATLTHLGYDPDPVHVVGRMERAVHWSLLASDIVDAARNVALFAGLGVVWVVTERPWRGLDLVARATLWGLGLSVAVESAQLVSLYRLSSINDVATNTVGALLGSSVVVALTVLLRRAHRRPSWLGVPLWGMSGAYVLAVSAEMFAPLYRREANPGAGGGLLSRLLNALHYIRPFSLHAVSPADVALFWPAGVLAVATLVEFGAGVRSAALATMAGGAALAILVELAHGVAGQPIDVSAIAGHIASLVLGAAIAWRWLMPLVARLRGRRRAALLLAAYALLLLAWAWRPFELRTSAREILGQLRPRHLTPLGMLGASEDLFGVSDVAEQFFLYAPLGFLLAVWPLRRRGWLGRAWPAIAFAAILETGQIFIRARLFDVTDLLTQCSAVLIAYTVVRRAGYSVAGQLLSPTAADVRAGARARTEPRPGAGMRPLIPIAVVAAVEALYAAAIAVLVLGVPELWLFAHAGLARGVLLLIAALAAGAAVQQLRRRPRWRRLAVLAGMLSLLMLAVLRPGLLESAVRAPGESGAIAVIALVATLGAPLWVIIALAVSSLSARGPIPDVRR